MAVLSHNATGYNRGCRCPICREGAVRRVAEWRARRNRKPCDICRRVHPGRCTPDDQRSKQLHLTLPGRVARRLRDHVAWGDRSRWVAALIERELDRLDDQDLAA